MKPDFSVLRRMKEIRWSDRLDLADFCLVFFSIFQFFEGSEEAAFLSLSTRVARRRPSNLEFSPAFLFQTFSSFQP